MPDTLCRACGMELREKILCQYCRQANQFTCSRCMFDTLIQYHDLCTRQYGMIKPKLVAMGQ